MRVLQVLVALAVLVLLDAATHRAWVVRPRVRVRFGLRTKIRLIGLN